MNEQIVVNTSPIIALGKMQAFDLISRLPLELICPSQVEAEIKTGERKGYAVSLPSFIKIRSLGSDLSPSRLANLDNGEAAVIELALENNIGLVCLDELKGRRAATNAGLRVVGSLGLIGKAKALGLVNRLRPLVSLAQASGIYYDSKLVDTFLAGFGE